MLSIYRRFLEAVATDQDCLAARHVTAASLELSILGDDSGMLEFCLVNGSQDVRVQHQICTPEALAADRHVLEPSFEILGGVDGGGVGDLPDPQSHVVGIGSDSAKAPHGVREESGQVMRL